ncbi:MAG: hypothetical protein KKF30_08645 [Proteobacteria bacterium]|nr:hypothetical protein [Pseudomonadota bacterium]MBU4471741.1 hypothetical protein [Pseudomonadota bacterium]MCG2750522.1 hypothetical protein [Desulfobacteraceae bacterium]
MNAKNEEKLDRENRKKLVYDAMSPRRQKHIEKKGYEDWDPFIEPKDPIDIRKDKTKRTSQSLIREFLQTRPLEGYSNEYGQGAFQLCLGLINEEDRYRGMFEFACWYYELLKKEGYEV